MSEGVLLTYIVKKLICEMSFFVARVLVRDFCSG